MSKSKLRVETLVELAASVPGSFNVKAHALETASFEVGNYCFDLHYEFCSDKIEATVYNPYTETIRITDARCQDFAQMTAAVSAVQAVLNKHNASVVK